MLTHRATSLALQIALLALIAGTLAYAGADWRKGSPVPGPGGEVVATAVTPDGSRAATVTADGHASLWDLDSRKLIRTRHLPDGQPIHLALRDQGDALAIAYEDADALIWWCDGSDKVIRPNVRARLVAFAHHKRLMVTLNQAGGIDAWDIDHGQHLVGSIQRTASYPLEVLHVLPSDRAAIAYDAGKIHNSMGIELSQGARLFAGGSSRLNITNATPLTSADGVITTHYTDTGGVTFSASASNGKSLLNETGKSDMFPPVCVIEQPPTPSGGGWVTVHGPEVTHRYAPVMDNRSLKYILTGNTTGDLIVYRRARANDWIKHPAPWMVIPAFFLLGWVVLKRRWERLEHPPDQPTAADAALDLPRPTVVACWVTAVMGALFIAGMIYDHLATGTCMLNLGVLALPAGILILRRKSNGWRKFAAFCGWVTMAAGALLFGVASIGQQPLEFTVGSRVSYQPIWVGSLVAAALLGLGVFLYLALTHPRARRICRAASSPAVGTRQQRLAAMKRCRACGYNTTQTVLDNRHQCPECGANIGFTAEQRGWLIDEQANQSPR